MIWNCYKNFNCKDFGHCIDWLRLAAQSLYRISGHPEVFTAIIKTIIQERYYASSSGNSEKSEPQMVFEPTTLRDQVRMLTNH